MTEQTSRLAIVLDSSGAKNNADNLATALAKITQAGEQAEKATDNLKHEFIDYNIVQKSASKEARNHRQELSEQQKALAKLRDQIDPVSAALDKLDDRYQKLKEFQRNGFLPDDDFDYLASKIRETEKALNGEAIAEREVAKAREQQGQSLQRLVSQLDPFSAALEKIKKQRIELAAAKDSGLLSPQYHAELSGKLDSTEKNLRKVSTEMRYGSISASQYRNAMRLLPMQLNDVATSLAGGMPLFTIFMQQGSQIADSFGGWGSLFDIIREKILGTGDAADDSSDSLSENANALGENAENAKKLTGFLGPATIGIGAMVAVVGALTYAWYKGSQEQFEFNKSLIMTGNIAGVTSAQLADMAKSVAESTGNPTAVAAEALNRIVSGGKIARESMKTVTEAVVAMNDATDESIDNMVADFELIAKDPVAAMNLLNDKYHFLTLATYEQIKALQDQGNQQEAARVLTETYAATMKQRSDEIASHLGVLQSAWKGVWDTAKGAWDAMWDIGREKSIDQKIADVEEAISRAQAVGSQPTITGFAPLDNLNAKAGKQDNSAVKALKAQLRELNSQKIAQETINELHDGFLKKQQDEIKLQQKADAFSQKYQTRQQQRDKELTELANLRNKYSKEDYDRLSAEINERYKDPKIPKTPKTPKGKAYTEDAATRLLDQINQQTAAMQSQLDASDKLNSATQARVKFEKQIADLKSKTQLTADQKSILSRSDEILQAYKNQEALQNSVKTLDDYRKMQDQVRSKDEQTNNLLRDRLELLEKAKATGQLKPGEYEKTRADIYQNTDNQLPSTVRNVVGNATPTGGELSGTYGGMQQQYNQLAQAQQQLDAWLKAQEEAYSRAVVITAEGEARMQKARADAANASAIIEAQKEAIITSSTQSMMDSTVSIMRDGFGEQSAVYKIAFAADKAYAIAQSIVAINGAMAKAANWGTFPANLIAMASIAAQTASIVSNISAVSLTGMAHNGIDSVPSTGTWLLEKGERVMTAQTSARLDSTLENLRKNGMDATLSKPGYGTGVQNVSSNQNSTTVHAPIEQNVYVQGGDPEQLTATLRKNNDELSKRLTKQIEQKMTGEVLNPQGNFGRALNSRYVRGYKE